MPAPDEPKVLDYEPAPPPVPPLKMRDSIEYYREPPMMAEWTVGQVLGWIIAFVVIAGAVLGVIGHAFAAAWK